MGGYQWDFSGLLPYFPAFVRGFGITLGIATLASLFGTLGAFPLVLLLRVPGLRLGVAALIDVVRAVPNLVLIFFFYYLPYRDLFGMAPVTGFVAVVAALTLAQAAYSADLLRAAFDQVPRVQVVGVQGLGFRPMHITLHVVLPAVLKQALPGHVALWIGNVKLSSLASVVAVEEVVYVARVAMAQNFRSLESWVVVAFIYAMLVIPLTYALRRLELSRWIRRQ